jgi:hypothetical protein
MCRDEEIDMDHKLAGLLGAFGALASMGTAQATPVNATDALQAHSYADLLKPIPNATATLEALDREADNTEPNVQLAQFFIEHHHHHHHHHHAYRRFRAEPRVVIIPRGYRHHHHHHHHHSYYRRYRDDD